MEDQIKMDKKSSSPDMKLITVGCILLLLVLANSMMNYSYAVAPQAPIKPSITITANSSSLYSIPSTFVKVDRYSANYIIAGKISSINASVTKRTLKQAKSIVGREHITKYGQI